MGVFTNDISKEGTHGASKNISYYLRRIGVSVLFSGAAVGVSHVVQATRAGADFSLALLPLIALCLFLKYPAFLFGPLYTKVTGESVVTGYRRIGKWTIPVVGISFICVMATVVAAVSMLAAGILASILGISFNITVIALALALSCTVVSLYSSFDRFQESIKIVFFLLVAMSVAALVLAIPSASTQAFSFEFDLGALDNRDIFFLAALIGWMPAGLDLPMMHSQWLLARVKPVTEDENVVEDFNFGYLSTTFLALLFVVIGAVFFFGTGTSVASSAGGFTKQLLDAYSTTLGSMGGFIIGMTLLLAIFSSLIVVVDGFPRVLSEVCSLGFHGTKNDGLEKTTRYRKVSAWLQFLVAAIILLAFTSSLTALVDFATVTSFLLGPLFAILNHKLVGLPEFTTKAEIARHHRFWSLLGIVFFSIFTIYYVFLRFA